MSPLQFSDAYLLLNSLSLSAQGSVQEMRQCTPSASPQPKDRRKVRELVRDDGMVAKDQLNSQ